ESTLAWDRRTGEPIGRAIVWQDRRTAGACEKLLADGAGALITGRTGLVVDAYFSATKLQWLLEHTPGARAAAEAGHLAFGTLDTWLVWKLTGGTEHVTDVTNASRTMLFNIHTGAWDDDLLALFQIPRTMLPDVVPSSNVHGVATIAGLRGVPVASLAGDQQAALFGQGCIRPGMAKNTYGTGCFLLLHTGGEAVTSRNRLVTTAAASIQGGPAQYALEGSIFIAGAVIQWLRDGLGIIRKSSDVEALAASVPDSGGVHLVPAFAGLGAPYWDPHARGTITGITRGTTAAHLARAALEGIAFQTAEVLEAMHADCGFTLREMRVDGGAAVNDLLMQFQADLIGVPVVRPAITETTALGVAYLAGLAVGIWLNPEEISEQWRADRTFEPQLPADRRAELLAGWRNAIARARSGID
ncbi:MAG: FGGY family carbohydrate kinase, partial [Chthoniobacteraceae bacterium]